MPELASLSANQFYVPDKKDWLTETHTSVEWLNYEQFKLTITPQLINKRAPLCWRKEPKVITQKLFVVWSVWEYVDYLLLYVLCQ